MEGHKSDVLAMDDENSKLADELELTKELLEEAKASLINNLRLIPEDMHLDGESDVPNVQASLYSVSKLFATAGGKF